MVVSFLLPPFAPLFSSLHSLVLFTFHSLSHLPIFNLSISCNEKAGTAQPDFVFVCMSWRVYGVTGIAFQAGSFALALLLCLPTTSVCVYMCMCVCVCERESQCACEKGSDGHFLGELDVMHVYSRLLAAKPFLSPSMSACVHPSF